MPIRPLLATRERHTLTVWFSTRWMGVLLLCSAASFAVAIAGCQCSGPRAACSTDLECFQPPASTCRVAVCNRGSIDVRGYCEEQPDPMCMDTSMPDAPTLDAPVDVPTPDAPRLDARADAPVFPRDTGGVLCVTCLVRLSAILLGDSQRVVASPSGPTLSGGPGAAANVIVPTASTLATLTDLAESTIAEGTTFGSELGASPITLSSSLQTVTATHDGARYALSGLLGAAVFASSDTLTVAGTTAGGPLSVPITAPSPITAASDLLDAPTGLTSTVSWPDGQCDAFIVQATLAGSGLPGESQVIRRVACADAPLVGGRRRIRILDDAALSELTARGLTVTDITVGVVNEADCSGFFPGLGDVPCQAGRLLRLPLSALLPFDPGPCGDPVTFAGNVEIRWSSDVMTCDIIRTGEPGATGIDVARIDTRSGGSVWRYTILSASHGTVSGMRIDGMPFSTDITVSLREPFGATLTITFRIESDTLSVSSFEVT
jgi:hypothetical protein